METLNLEKFEPTVAKLQEMVMATKKITSSDTLPIIKAERIGLRNIRVSIEKRGKELRTDAINFQKAVINKEKELIAIIEPEETRLAKIEEDIEMLDEMQKRKEKLPENQLRLQSVGVTITPEMTEQLLKMSLQEVDLFYNQLLGTKNENDRLALEAEKEKIRIEQEEQVKQARAKELEAENTRLKQQAQQDAKERELRDRELKVKTDAERLQAEEKARIEERARQERLAKERQIAEEKARIEEEQRKEEVRIKEHNRLNQMKKYQAFLGKYGYTEETKENFYILKSDDEINLYKKVGTFKLK